MGQVVAEQGVRWYDDEPSGQSKEAPSFDLLKVVLNIHLFTNHRCVELALKAKVGSYRERILIRDDVG